MYNVYYIYICCVLYKAPCPRWSEILRQSRWSLRSPHPPLPFFSFIFLGKLALTTTKLQNKVYIIGLWYFHDFSKLRLLRRKEVFVNRLQDRLDSLHYDHRVAVFLTLMNTAVTNGLRYSILFLTEEWCFSLFLPFTDMEDSWAFKHDNFQVVRLYTGSGYFLKWPIPVVVVVCTEYFWAVPYFVPHSPGEGHTWILIVVTFFLLWCHTIPMLCLEETQSVNSA